MLKSTVAPRRTRLAIAALVPALIGLVAVVPAAEAAAPPVHVASSSIGKILVDGKSMTVYMFTGDSKNKSNCKGACATNWPPVIVSSTSVAKAPGVRATLGTIKRSASKLQLTVNGSPVYTFKGDTSKGQITGQGVSALGAKWWVLSPRGAKITTTPGGAAPAPSTPTDGY